MKEIFKHYSDYHIRRLKNDEKVKSFDCIINKKISFFS